MDKIKLLFVCVENSNRSQMAEAFAKIHGGDTVEAYSAGSRPSGKVNPKAIDAMKQLNYDLTTHISKSLEAIPDTQYHAVITMGCGENCPFIPALIHEDWKIPDPKDMTPEQFLSIRNLIQEKVVELLNRLT